MDTKAVRIDNVIDGGFGGEIRGQWRVGGQWRSSVSYSLTESPSLLCTVIGPFVRRPVSCWNNATLSRRQVIVV